MSLNHSPSIVTNGLVFAYDMGNTKKSWKGAPATNLLISSTDLTNNTYWSTYAAVRAVSTNVTAPDGTYTAIAFSGDTTSNYHALQQFYSGFTAGLVYTTSVYARAGTGNTLYMQYSPTSFGVWAAATYDLTLGTATPLNGATATITNVGSGWYRCSLTATATITASSQGSNLYSKNNIYVGLNSTTNPELYLWQPQLEVGSLTPWVNGSRSNTQAIADLTGKNTVTATSLTYASDGTFSFNGTSDYLTIPFNASLFTFNNEQTIIIWMKNNSPSAARRNPYDQAYAGGGTITHENDTGFNYYYGTQGGNGTPYTNIYSSFNVVVGETAMICLTRNTSTLSWYKNGVFSNSSANPYGGTVVTGTNNIRIGTGYAGYFGGNLYNVQLYNRALSAAEVLQNFNALRGRYGL